MIGSIFPTNVKVNGAVSVVLFQEQSPHTEAFDRIKICEISLRFRCVVASIEQKSRVWLRDLTFGHINYCLRWAYFLTTSHNASLLAG